MQFLRPLGFRPALAAMQWRRGLRAGIAVGTIMLACLLFRYPMGWPALGAFQVIFVDNGGPYRSRFANIFTILLGGSLAVSLGILAGGHANSGASLTIATFGGGISNSGMITAGLTGIAVNNVTTFLGGISNSGRITGNTGIVIGSGVTFAGGAAVSR